MTFFVCFQKVMDHGELEVRKQIICLVYPKGGDGELWKGKGSYRTIAL